jgi:uncharacterized membrane protein YdfJ with MMPL/SSD domain
MLAGLADLINRHPWRILAVSLAPTAIAAPLGIHVRDHLKPRGFDVAGSGSAKAREPIARASGADPANSVLALVRLSLLAAFAGDPQVTLGGNPVANHEISTTIEDDLRRAELLAVPLIALSLLLPLRGFVASLLAPAAGAITVLVSFFLLRELASVNSLSIIGGQDLWAMTLTFGRGADSLRLGRDNHRARRR